MSFSLISPNSVRSLNIQAANVRVTLDDSEEIIVNVAGTSYVFYLKADQNLVYTYNLECRFLNRNFSLEKCLKHFLVALNLLEVDQLLVSRNHEACDKLAGIKWRIIIMLGKNRPLFDHIYRDAKNVSLSDRGLLNKHTRAILSENLNSIGLNFSFVMDLNDLLAINVTKAEVYFSFTLSNVNLFLRHFINGSNPRLSEICIELKRRENLEDSWSFAFQFCFFVTLQQFIMFNVYIYLRKHIKNCSNNLRKFPSCLQLPIPEKCLKLSKLVLPSGSRLMKLLA